MEPFRLQAAAGQQLFFDSMIRSYQMKRDSPRAASPPPTRMPRHVELVLFEACRELRLFRPTGLDLANPQLIIALNTARHMAAQRGWSAATLRGIERGLGALLSHYPIGNPVPYSDVTQLRSLSKNISLGRTADVLAELGLLRHDRPDALDDWITRRLDVLPAAMRDELRVWVNVLRGRAPRSRAKSDASVRRYLGYVLPHLVSWVAIHPSLREITHDHVEAVLHRFQGHQRSMQLCALRSLFSTLKKRRVIFRDPTTGFHAQQVGQAAIPAPLPDSVLAAVADAADDPERRLLFVLAALQALRPHQMRQLLLADIDLEQRQLTVDGHSRPLDPITYDALINYLRHRHTRWPLSPNPYLIVTMQTAHESGPVSQTWNRDRFGGLPAGLDRLRMDRYLEELLTHGPDPLHCQAVFGVSVKTAVRYASAAAALLGTTIEHAFTTPGAQPTPPLQSPDD